jgi:hypothetical protein
MTKQHNQTHGALTEEFERHFTVWMLTDVEAWKRPYRNRLGTYWKRQGRSLYFKQEKSIQNKRERKRAKIDPECVPFYGKHYGWYW